MSCIYSIDELNEWVYNKSLRKYQYEILLDREFCIKVNNQIIPFPKFNISDDQTFFSSAIDDKNILVMHDHGRGYPLELLDNPALINKYKINQPQDKCSEVNRQRIFVIGHRNFAHTLWNSAQGILDFQKEHADILDETFFFERQSYLKVSDLIELKRTVTLNELSLKHDSFLPISSCYISSELSSSFLNLCNKKATGATGKVQDKILEVKREGRKVFLFSAQSFDKRVLINQIDFITHAIKCLNSSFYKPLFILDGFSETFSNSQSRKIIEETNKVINQIIEIIQDHDSSIELVNLNGFSLYDCALVYEHIDYACTHEGTQHHKISWFHKINHFIHSPSPSISCAKWHKDQSEIATMPSITPIELIEPDNNLSLPTRNRNYKIIDVKLMCDFLLNDAIRALSN